MAGASWRRVKERVKIAQQLNGEKHEVNEAEQQSNGEIGLEDDIFWHYFWGSRRAPLNKNYSFGSLFRRPGLSTFVHDGLVELVAEGVRKLVKLVIAVDLDGLFGGVHDYFALMAPLEMLLQLYLHGHIGGAIQVVGQLF